MDFKIQHTTELQSQISLWEVDSLQDQGLEINLLLDQESLTKIQVLLI